MKRRKITFYTIIGSAIVLASLGTLLSLILMGRFSPINLAATAIVLERRATEDAANLRATEAALLALATDTALTATEADTAAVSPVQAETPRASEAGKRSPAQNDVPNSITNTGDVAWNGLRIEIVGANYDAWPLIKANNQNNEPPLDGMKMLLVTVRVTNAAGMAGEPVGVRDSDFELIGSRRNVYRTFEAGCGVVPDSLDATLVSGASVDGNVCFQAAVDDEDFKLIYAPFDAPAVYFDTPGPAEMDGFSAELPPALVEVQELTWDGLQIDIIDLDYTAWPLIKAHNSHNDPPLAGMSPLLITLRATNVEGAERFIRLWQSDFKLAGSQNRIYETFEVSCGVIPDELSGVVELGNYLEGKVCFQVSENEDHFKLIYEPSGAPAVYFELPARTPGK